MAKPGCSLCETPGGVLIFEGERFRVIRAEEAVFPAFYRLVWRDHVAEFSDLGAQERQVCMDAVSCIEQVMRDQLQPTKINLAALGNVVPHLHWHVVARFDWDTHFPSPIWAEPVRPSDAERLGALQRRLPLVDVQLQRALAALR